MDSRSLLYALVEECKKERLGLTLPIDSVGFLAIDKNDPDIKIQVTPNCISLIKDGDILKEIVIDKAVREYEESKNKKKLFSFLSR